MRISEKVPGTAVLGLMALMILGVALVVGAQDCIPPPSQMVGWWPLDGSTTDIEGVNDGTLSGPTSQFVSGLVSEGFKSSGLGLILISHVDDFVNNHITIDTWVRLDGFSTGNMSIIWKGNAAGGSVSTPYALSIIGPNGPYPPGGPYLQGTIMATISDGTIQQYLVTDGYVLPIDGQFHHIAVTVDDCHYRIYVDGLLKEDVTPTAPPTAATGHPIQIGNVSKGVQDDVNSFNGVIDEVELHSRALTQPEIQDIVDAGSTGKCKMTTPDPSGCIRPPSEMVSWWPLDGTTVDIGGDNDGTLNGPSSQFVPGLVGEGFKSDGLGVIEIPHAGSLIVEHLTLDAWVRRDGFSTGNMSIVWKGNPAGTSLSTPYAVSVIGPTGPYPPGGPLNEGTIFATISDGTNYQYLVTAGYELPADGQFHHVAVTVDDCHYRVYVDGILEASTTPTVLPTTTTTFPIQIGNVKKAIQDAESSFNGVIDEVELHSRALTQAEIQDLVDARSTGKCKFTNVTYKALTCYTECRAIPGCNPDCQRLCYKQCYIGSRYSLAYAEDIVSLTGAQAIFSELVNAGFTSGDSLLQLLREILPEYVPQTDYIRDTAFYAPSPTGPPEASCCNVLPCGGTCVSGGLGCFCYEFLPHTSSRELAQSSEGEIVVLLLANPGDDSLALSAVAESTFVCVCPCKYDPLCDGTVSDVLDVVSAISRAFRGFTPPVGEDSNCLTERCDVDNSGTVDVVDIVKVVNVSFRGQSIAANYVDPCL